MVILCKHIYFVHLFSWFKTFSNFTWNLNIIVKNKIILGLILIFKNWKKFKKLKPKTNIFYKDFLDLMALQALTSN